MRAETKFPHDEKQIGDGESKTRTEAPNMRTRIEHENGATRVNKFGAFC
jgi:hypothetical protein